MSRSQSNAPSARSSRAERTRPFAEKLYARYHLPETIGADPLAWARRFDRPDDREVAAFLAAALAYGNVVQINRSLDNLFGRMGGTPARFCREFTPGRSDAALEGFYHRFNTGIDLAASAHLIGQMMRGWGSIEGFWKHAQRPEDAASGPEGKDDDIATRAGHFMRAAFELDLEPYRAHIGNPPKLPFIYLWPKADGSSACKRLNLFLRWVVRPDDGVDLGLWSVEKPRDLQFPVDTHVLRIARYLGATRRKTADARARREITKFFARIDPEDPVRFDFAVCRLGILKHCPTQSRIEACRQCELRTVCDRRRRMERLCASEKA